MRIKRSTIHLAHPYFCARCGCVHAGGLARITHTHARRRTKAGALRCSPAPAEPPLTA